MRRLALAVVVLALHATPQAQAPAASRPSPADPLVRLMADLEGALASGRGEAFRAIAAPSIPQQDVDRFTSAVDGGHVTAAAVRERARRPTDEGFEILAEVFVAHGRRGRIATWQLNARPRAGVPDRAELTGLVELASVDGLLRLSLDATRQFAVRKLLLEAPDFTVKLDEGTAFVAESDSGVTGLVLRGRAEVHFTPPSAAEQGQVRLFSGRPAFASDADAVYLRLNPAEFSSLISAESLVAAAFDPREFARAQEVFADRSPRTYSLDPSADRRLIAPPHPCPVREHVRQYAAAI